MTSIGVLGAALALAACSSGADMTGSASARVRAWVGASGLTSTSATIADDLNRIERAQARGDLLSVKTECELIGGDTGSASGELPTPDQALSDRLSATYEALMAAASSCAGAASRGDGGGVVAASAHLRDADHRLDRAVREAMALER